MRKNLILTIFVLYCLNLGCIANEQPIKIAAAGYSGSAGYHSSKMNSSSGGHTFKSSGYNSNTINSSSQPSSEISGTIGSRDNAQMTKLLDKWLASHPQQAAELQQINSSEQLKKWLEANPSVVNELQQLFFSQ